MKPWYESKLTWMNIILTLIGILTLVAEYLTNSPILTAPGIIMVVVGALGVVLRVWFTDTPIKTPARLLSTRLHDIDNYGPR